MKIVAMIPARYDSERLPGKLMMDLGGIPVILRTYQNVISSGLFDEVFVITDSEIIYKLINNNGGNALMSSIKHDNGSDRIAEFASKINSDLILNVQGDEPFIDKSSLEKLISVFIEDEKKNIDLAIINFKKVIKLDSNNSISFYNIGHLYKEKEVVTDFLYQKGRVYKFSSKRIKTKNTHGTGCSLASAVTANLYLGKSLKESVKLARNFVNKGILKSFSIGSGHNPINHFIKN